MPGVVEPAPASLTNIRLEWKWQKVTKTLLITAGINYSCKMFYGTGPYCNFHQITAVKCFIVQAPTVIFIKVRHEMKEPIIIKILL